MCINLCCGDNPWEGFINVDAIENEGVDVVMDVTKHLVAFPNDRFEEVWMRHSIERR